MSDEPVRGDAPGTTGRPDRSYWLETLVRVASPVFTSLARGQLRNRMPVEVRPGGEDRSDRSHLEALGRSIAGIAPWLDLESADPSEAQEQSRMRSAVVSSLDEATDRSSPDFMNFTEGSKQPLVDASFLALGLLRGWNRVWLGLASETQTRVVDVLTSTRIHDPWLNNWLLFPAIIEAFLRKAGAGWEEAPIERALRTHESWYLGDGVYGDGAQFRFDHYNGFVIHPFQFELIKAVADERSGWSDLVDSITSRLQRYAEIQERLIAPDGSFPPIGRSLTYRFGAFHALALVASETLLPSTLSPGSVRSALTAVIKRGMEPHGTFNSDGWLNLGLSGHQPSLAESYISTGSLYICLCVMLPLGLPADAPFWSDPGSAWTSKRLWSGEDVGFDHPRDDLRPDVGPCDSRTQPPKR